MRCRADDMLSVTGLQPSNVFVVQRVEYAASSRPAELISDLVAKQAGAVGAVAPRQ